MISFVIYIVGNALGTPNPHVDGLYLKNFTPDADLEGRGMIETCASVEDAKSFMTSSAALEFWRQQSRIRPLRPDGKPNRPLTAYTVEILRSDKAPI
jgi:hypothetical protein